MVFFLYSLMCLIFGTTFLFIKLGLEVGWSPFLFSSLRFVIAGVIVVIFVWIVKKLEVYPIAFHFKIFKLAFLMTTIPFAALYWGEQYISSGEAAILVATSPVFILLINHLMKTERITQVKAIGALISMLGIILTVFNEIDFSSNIESFYAKCFLLIAEIAFAYGSVKSKKVLSNVKNPFLFNGFQMLYGGSLLFLLSFLFQENYSLPVKSYGWSILAYFIFFASILSYGIFYWLIKNTSAFFSSTWTYISPVIAMMLGFIIFGEVITWLGLMGSILILLGVLLSNIQYFKIRRIVVEEKY